MKWDTTLYQQSHAFVYRYGEELVALLDPQRGERILDVGCGTGQLTASISKSGAEAVGIDSSPEMIAAARAAHPNLTFVVADAADFRFGQPFDAIFSNAALHWVTRAEDAVVCMAEGLRPGGRFVVEMGGKGNIARITAAVEDAMWEVVQVRPQHGRFYPGIGEYAPMLERHGLRVTSASLFERCTTLSGGEAGMRQWLAMFEQGVMSDLNDVEKQKVFEKVECLLRPALYKDGEWLADYRRLRIVAIKE